jgi:hypothetical protein
MFMIRRLSPILVIVLLCQVAKAEFATPSDALTFFEEKIRPVLADKCFSCHSAEAKKLKGSLQVDHLEHLLSGGDTGAALIPGKPDESLLIEAIAYGNPDLRMPPKEKLAPEVVDDFRRWITAGAPWPEETLPVVSHGSAPEAFVLEKRKAKHWCWRPIVLPAIPEVTKKDWPQSPIDHFILKKIEDSGLIPALPADERSWFRRVTFDLTGLPPTRDELHQFLSSKDPDKRASVVETLLASPHFGEKWARHWMDLVRYADSFGHEFDYPLAYAFEYRDYLIRALNANVPYDQFVKEHIAGDLIPNPRLNPEENFNESVLGTGFWYLNEATHAPTDVLANEADHMSTQIDVYSKAFLGLTVSCARCHDHKFDAISTADYYALTGYLHSSARTERPMDPGGVRSTAAEQQRAILTSANSDFHFPGGIDFGKYLTVSTTLVREMFAQAPPVEDPWKGIEFDDFEDGYGKWEVSGDSFTEGPSTAAIGAQKPITGFSGKHFANSFSRKGDKPQGELRSKPFPIEKPFINFLIGGGSHAITAFELHIDGKQVRTASGKNVDAFSPVSWDVSEFSGKTGELRMVDKHDGGWGHVILDRIVFSDTPVTTQLLLPEVGKDLITRAATTNHLDPDILSNWCRIITTAEEKKATPESRLRSWTNAPESLKPVKAQIEQAAKQQEDFLAGSILYEDFSGSEFPEGWSVTGEGFAPTGEKAGYTLAKDHLITSPGLVTSALLGEAHSGVLRSPTFTINSDNIHVLLRGHRGMMRVVIDNYHMATFQPLLFRGTILKDIDTDDQFQWKSLNADLKKYRGHRAYLEFVDAGPGYLELDEIRFSDNPAPPAPHHPLSRLVAVSDPGQLPAALNSAASGDPVVLDWLAAKNLIPAGAIGTDAGKQLAEGRQLGRDLPAERFALTMADGTPEKGHIYVRGSYRSPGDEVPLRSLEALGAKEGDRLFLAGETVSESNPLTARVITNRLWHYLIGKGIVASVDDFGPMGQAPSHPELLDWLASDFMANGWSLKHTIREIVLSSTYAQATTAIPEVDATYLANTDPTNLLLHRMPVRRLNAEEIRDAILTISGSLDSSLYGDPVPTHLTDFMSGRGARKSGPLDGEGRRTIYGAVYRNFLSPFLLTFDMPNPFGPKGNRGASNVPAQALALMNDPFVVDQAQQWGKRIAGGTETSEEDRIRIMVEASSGESPPEETVRLYRDFLSAQSADYGTLDERAWGDLAHVLFNTKQFLYLH